MFVNSYINSERMHFRFGMHAKKNLSVSVPRLNETVSRSFGESCPMNANCVVCI